MGGESGQVRARGRLHPVTVNGALGMVLFIGVCTAFIVKNNPDLEPGTVVRVIAGGVALSILSMVPTLGRLWNSELVVLDDKLAGRLGWFRVHAFEMPWADVGEVSLEESMLGRWLGYGTVRIVETDGAVSVFAQMSGAKAICDRARERIHGGNRSRHRAGD